MESEYLKTFVEVLRCGNFSMAATALHVTQSAVSRRIKTMEDHYGTILVNRRGPVLTPTESGRLVHEKARQILELENELACGLQRINGRSQFSFACSRPFGITYLPTVMGEFLKWYEGKVDVRLCFETPSEALEGLREHRHDIIEIEHQDDIDFSHFGSSSLGVDDMIFISSPQLGLPAPLISVDELACQRLYRRNENCCSTKMLSFNLSAIGRGQVEFKNVLFFDDLHTIIESVCAGMGISFISKSLVAGKLAEGKLLEHRVKGFIHSRKRSLVYRSETLQNKPQSDFITCLCNVIQQTCKSCHPLN